MDIQYEPLLQLQAALCEIPRGPARFEKYISLMRDAQGEMALPLSGFNPMGKDHVGERLARLLEMNVDQLGEEVAAEAAGMLAEIPGQLKLVVVLGDDAGGGWTDRHLTEAKSRLERSTEKRLGWATALCWTGDDLNLDQIYREMLGVIYRAAHYQKYKWPQTVAEALAQEGRTAVFAGVAPRYGAEELAYTADVVAPLLQDEGFPIIYSLLYGDETAIAAGYPPQGLSTRAGYDYARAMVVAQAKSVVDWLR